MTEKDIQTLRDLIIAEGTIAFLILILILILILNEEEEEEEEEEKYLGKRFHE